MISTARSAPTRHSPDLLGGRQPVPPSSGFESPAARWRSKPETIIVNEQYWNPNAKFADIVLPATTMLERDDIGSTSRDRHIIAMKRAIDPVAEARSDYDIFTALSERLGVKDKFTEGRNASAWCAICMTSRASARASLISTCRHSKHSGRKALLEIPPPQEPSVMMRKFRADPVANKLPTRQARLKSPRPPSRRSTMRIAPDIPHGSSRPSGWAARSQRHFHCI